VYALLTHPDQLARLRAEPELIPTAVEEFLRYDPPVMVTIPARTTAPVRLGDVTVPADEVVVPVLTTANHDPVRFAAPDELDITRADNPHVAFGHGIHHCLGAPLARLEARIALTHLLARLPTLRLARPQDEPARFPGLLLNGMSHLMVRVD
jgi:cytochrome P450